MTGNCQTKPCVDLKNRLDLYLMKSEMLRHLREQHGRWWERYEQIYARGQHTERTERTGPDAAVWDYSDRAKDILTRCRVFDNLYNGVVGLDLDGLQDFGGYCKRVFLEINKLKPAFPESSVSVLIFDATQRDLRKFVLLQNERLEERRRRAAGE